jgi:hypothetical protein
VSEPQLSILEQLAELEAMLRQLTLAALKLPPGPERRDKPLGHWQVPRAHSRFEAVRVSDAVPAVRVFKGLPANCRFNDRISRVTKFPCEFINEVVFKQSRGIFSEIIPMFS